MPRRSPHSEDRSPEAESLGSRLRQRFMPGPQYEPVGEAVRHFGRLVAAHTNWRIVESVLVIQYPIAPRYTPEQLVDVTMGHADMLPYPDVLLDVRGRRQGKITNSRLGQLGAFRLQGNESLVVQALPSGLDSHIRGEGARQQHLDTVERLFGNEATTVQHLARITIGTLTPNGALEGMQHDLNTEALGLNPYPILSEATNLPGFQNVEIDETYVTLH